MRLTSLMFALCFACLCWAGDKIQPSALLQRAAEVSDIRGLGATPFRLKAKVRPYEDIQDEATYELLWASADRWREEITVGSEKAIRIGGPGTVSLKNDNGKVRSVRAHIRSLNIPLTLTLRPQEFLSGVKSRKRNGMVLQCTTRKGKNISETDICFEPDKGILALEDYSAHGSEGRVVYFPTYMDFGGKLFPARVQTYSSTAIKNDIEVVSLDHLASTDLAAFTAGPEYTTMPGCEASIAPFALEAPDPIYPQQLKKPSPQNVKLTILVDQYGTVKNPLVIQSAGALDQYAIDSVSKWKFSPAMCGTQPVPFQVNVEINFRTY